MTQFRFFFHDVILAIDLNSCYKPSITSDYICREVEKKFVKKLVRKLRYGINEEVRPSICDGNLNLFKKCSGPKLHFTVVDNE